MRQGRRSPPTSQAAIYEIRVQGQLDPSWRAWLNGMTIHCEVEGDRGPVTTLAGELSDQAALRGLLVRLWNLNLALISVDRKDSTCGSGRKVNHDSPLHALSG
jgi:hypothetical protein